MGAGGGVEVTRGDRFGVDQFSVFSISGVSLIFFLIEFGSMVWTVVYTCSGISIFQNSSIFLFILFYAQLALLLFNVNIS